MTITYINSVATSKYWTFLRLLIRWKGSIYKIIWFELLIFSLLYTGLSLVHRFGLYGTYKSTFEEFCRFCKKYSNVIPVPFVLGFYVTLVVGRWWGQFSALPWPDSAALMLGAFLVGRGERAALYRRSILRYLNLSYCMVLASISSKAKKLFPDVKAYITNGLLLEEERLILDDLETGNNKYFVPIAWACKLVYKAANEKMTTGERGVEALLEEINNFRGSLGTVFAYDWINPPLVYTQIATISVHVYFLIFIFSEQFLSDSKIDLYVPLFGFLQFIFFMGWLKVAESLINPFGDDDDDFEIDEIITRNIKMSYIILDEMHKSYPVLDRDAFWTSDEPQFVQDYKGNKNDMFIGSLTNLNDDALIGSRLSVFSNNVFSSMNKMSRGNSIRKRSALDL